MGDCKISKRKLRQDQSVLLAGDIYSSSSDISNDTEDTLKGSGALALLLAESRPDKGPSRKEIELRNDTSVQLQRD